MQWRIQDFPDGVEPTPEFGVKNYYLAEFLLKTVWKWKNMNREKGGVSLVRTLLDPTMYRIVATQPSTPPQTRNLGSTPPVLHL